MLHLGLLYARAVLADEDGAELCFQRALEADMTRWPWLKARVELEYGRWLVGSGRLDVASEHLHRAREMFERLGAPRWIARARDALIEGYDAFEDTGASEQGP
jgi:hypothetical protein